MVVGKQIQRCRKPPRSVEHEAPRLRTVDVAHREARVVGLRGAASHEDAVGLRTPAMHERPGRLPRDPPAVPGRRRHTPVERLRDLEGNERPPRADVMEERLVQPGAFTVEHAEFDLDAVLTKPANASALDRGKRVDRAHDESRNAGFQHEIGARRRLAVVGARLQVDVERRVAQDAVPVFGQRGPDGVGLGVRAAVRLVPALGQTVTVGVHQHSPDERVRAHGAGSAAGELQAALHPSLVTGRVGRAHTSSM